MNIFQEFQQNLYERTYKHDMGAVHKHAEGHGYKHQGGSPLGTIGHVMVHNFSHKAGHQLQVFHNTQNNRVDWQHTHQVPGSTETRRNGGTGHNELGTFLNHVHKHDKK